jgi:predicted NUDIX family NTP pyrophosphohydrolase
MPAFASHNTSTSPWRASVLAGAVAVLVALAVPAGALAQVSFSGPINYAVGEVPSSVAAGDFDGDADPDLAVANTESDDVSVLLGGAGGAFAATTSISAGDYPYSLAVADFDDDADLDLATANAESNDVSVLLGGAGASFAAASDSPFSVGDNPLSVAVGDFNGDPAPDLAVANHDLDNISVLLGGAGASFAAAADSPFPAGGEKPISVAADDFDGDSRTDLAIANYDSGDVSVLLGEGDGSFGAATSYDAGDLPTSIAVGEFNGDADPDLAIANAGDDSVSVLLGTQGASFGAATDYSTGDQPWSVAVGDFNDDSDPDLAVANYGSRSVSVLVGGAGGSFGAATSFTADDGATAIAVADFDGDSDSDLAVANWHANNVSVLLNNRPPRPAATPPVAAPPVTAAPVTTAEPAISRVWLGSRCVRRTRSGRVRVPITMSLARPARLEIQIDRATKSKGRRTCPQAGRPPRPGHKTRFRTVTTIRRTPTQAAAAAAVARRLTLKLRLPAGLYRLGVRAQLQSGQMSAPIHRYLRVVG